MAESLPQPILVHREQEILFANHALAALAGYDSCSDLTALSLDGLLPQGLSHAGGTEQLRHKSGRLLEIEVNGAPITWEGRHATRIVCTEAAQETIGGRPNDTRWRDVMLNALLVGVTMVRLEDGVFVYANPQFESMCGYAHGGLVGTYAARIKAESSDSSSGQAEAIIAALKAEGSWSGEIHNLHQDRTEFWTRSSIIALDHPEHGPVGMGVHEDISVLKQRESELRRAEGEQRKSALWLEGVFDALDDTVLVVRPDRVLVGLNKAGERMFGYSKEELSNLSTGVLHVDQQHFEAFGLRIKEAFDRGEVAQFEFKARRKSGEVFPTEHSVSLLSNEDGESVGIVSVVRDITERKQAEEVLRQTLRQKETLLREVHHRVKNNLQVVSSLLHFQAQKVDDPDVANIFIESRERLYAMMLVHEQLYRSTDLSRIDFASYLQSLVARLREVHSTDEAQLVQLEVVVPKRLELPIKQALPGGMVVCELVTNVLKHAFPGGVSGRAQVSLREDEGCAFITVRDDGVGLPTGFDPARVESFGWQLIRSLADQLDGTVTIDNAPGTSVTVSIPLPGSRNDAEACMGADRAPSMLSHRSEEAGAAGVGARIYVVEDEALIAMEIEDGLRKLGHRVCGSSRTGERALDEVPELRPDLVLMDINLAGELDGTETAARLREVDGELMIIFLSAYSTGEAEIREGYANVGKPLHWGQLEATVQRLLTGRPR